MKNKLIYVPLGIIFIFVLVVVTTLAGCYHGDAVAIDYFSNPAPGVTVEEESDRIIFAPENAEVGLIFYQGANVETVAYSPLLEECAENGILVVAPKMPVNFAVLNKNAADEILDDYPQIEHWFISGHSLGGAMACSYLEENYSRFDGLILLASFSAVDLSEFDFSTLSLYGTKDGVLEIEKYNDRLEFLPNVKNVPIEGGNHAQFGSYGFQKKDNEAEISQAEQNAIAVQEITNFIGGVIMNEVHN